MASAHRLDQRHENNGCAREKTSGGGFCGEFAENKRAAAGEHQRAENGAVENGAHANMRETLTKDEDAGERGEAEAPGQHLEGMHGGCAHFQEDVGQPPGGCHQKQQEIGAVTRHADAARAGLQDRHRDFLPY